MGNTRYSAFALSVCIGLSFYSARGGAQSIGPSDPTASPPFNAEPAVSPAYQYSTDEGALEEREEKRHRLVGGSTIGIPIALDVDHDVVRPGATLQFWGGFDIGYFVFGFDAGFQWNPIDLDASNEPMSAGEGKSPLHRIFFGPEVRFQVPNLGRVLPYVSAAFDINFWNFRETDVVCDFWYCSEVSVYRFTPGFTSKVGTAIDLKDGFMLDLGFKWALTGEGDFFDKTRYWVEPFIGILIRRP